MANTADGASAGSPAGRLTHRGTGRLDRPGDRDCDRDRDSTRDTIPAAPSQRPILTNHWHKLESQSRQAAAKGP